MIPCRAILLLLSFLMFPLSASAAPILIYKGTGKQVGKSNAIVSGPVNVYFLVDVATKQVARLTYYTRGKQKFSFNFPASEYHQTSFTLVTGKTSVVYSKPIVFETPDEFIDIMKAARGTNSPLKINSAAVVPFLHPKAISGFEFTASTNGTPNANELRYTAAYQQKRSIAANDANKTLTQVYEELRQELIAKGY